MRVSELSRYQVVTVPRSADLTAAARLMREHHVGYLVVVEPGVPADAAVPVGVLTDRDLVVSVIASGADPNTLRVGDVMTPKPICVTEDDSIDSALDTMRLVGVRRLPVTGVGGTLTGVVSLDDIIDRLAAEFSSVAGSIRNEQRMERGLRP